MSKIRIGRVPIRNHGIGILFCFILSKKKADTVQILSRVELKNVKNGMKMAYTIVSETEANLKEGKISVNTPIAQGLLGKKVGDVAEITIPQGKISLEVTGISF